MRTKGANLRRKIINSIDIVLDTGCWEWRKSINKAGYGDAEGYFDEMGSR